MKRTCSQVLLIADFVMLGLSGCQPIVLDNIPTPGIPVKETNRIVIDADHQFRATLTIPTDCVKAGNTVTLTLILESMGPLVYSDTLSLSIFDLVIEDQGHVFNWSETQSPLPYTHVEIHPQEHVVIQWVWTIPQATSSPGFKVYPLIRYQSGTNISTNGSSSPTYIAINTKNHRACP